ncbi:MAG TPA: Mur ligase domain-containing protein, partial [Anaeromyxobacter sp.]
MTGPRFTSDELADASGGRWSGTPPVEVGGVSTDTRTIAPGSLFVALRGERFDAHDFLGEAAAKGAAAAVVADAWVAL